MQELISERRNAVKAIVKTGFEPVWFEDFGPRSTSPQEAYVKELSLCDVYVGIFGRKYSADTINEYSVAKELGLELVILLKKVPKRNKRLERFLKQIKKQIVYSDFHLGTDLKLVLEDKLLSIKKTLRKRKKTKIDLNLPRETGGTTARIFPGSHHFFAHYLRKGGGVKAEIVSNIPVDVFVLDKKNMEKYLGKEPFKSLTGGNNVRKLDVESYISRDDRLTILVENRSQTYAEVHFHGTWIGALHPPIDEKIALEPLEARAYHFLVRKGATLEGILWATRPIDIVIADIHNSNLARIYGIGSSKYIPTIKVEGIKKGKIVFNSPVDNYWYLIIANRNKRITRIQYLFGVHETTITKEKNTNGRG